MNLLTILLFAIIYFKCAVSFHFPRIQIRSQTSFLRTNQHIQSSFDEFLDSMDAPVLVDFYAEWCGPCRMMAPVLQDIASRFENVAKIAKIDTDKAANLAMKYQVEALPTLILFYKGEIIDRYIGYRDADTLERELVQVAIPRINGSVLGQFINRVVFIVIDATRAQKDPYSAQRWNVKSADGFDVVLNLPLGETIERSVFLPQNLSSVTCHSSYVHIEGKVNPGNVIEVINAQPMSNNFEINNYNRAVELMLGKYSSLFN